MVRTHKSQIILLDKVVRGPGLVSISPDNKKRRENFFSRKFTVRHIAKKNNNALKLRDVQQKRCRINNRLLKFGIQFNSVLRNSTTPELSNSTAPLFSGIFRIVYPNGGGNMSLLNWLWNSVKLTSWFTFSLSVINWFSIQLFCYGWI